MLCTTSWMTPRTRLRKQIHPIESDALCFRHAGVVMGLPSQAGRCSLCVQREQCMHPAPSDLTALRARIARIERRPGAYRADMLRFGVDAIDGHLPGGGLLTGALHEVAGDGPDLEHGAAAAQFLAGLLARAASGPGDLRPCRRRWLAGHGRGIAPSGARRRGGRSRQDGAHRLPPAAARGRGFGSHRLRPAPLHPRPRPGARRAERGGDTMAHRPPALAAAHPARAGRAGPGACPLAAGPGALPRRRPRNLDRGGV